MTLPDLSQFEYAFLLSQAFAACALVSDFISFQLKSRVAILLLLTLSCVFLTIHYVLLDSAAAAIVVGISAIRFFVASRTQHVAVALSFLAASIIGTLATWRIPADVLVLLGGALANTASFADTDKKLRLIMMLATSCFLVYNALIFSPVGILVEISFLSSNFLGYYRHYLRKT